MRTVLDPFIIGYRVEFTDYDQVSDVIDGKRVLGPPQDIREVQNAYEAYEIMTRLNPYSVKDLLKAHKIMMEELVKETGVFRSKGVGVYSGEQLIHAGTPANYVPDLIGQLFEWLNKSKLKEEGFVYNKTSITVLIETYWNSAKFGIRNIHSINRNILECKDNYYAIHVYTYSY